ncbi:GNAT family N-acetyltransferase [Phreatobacter sp. HK31-P]
MDQQRTGGIAIRRAVGDDLGFIVETERIPEHAGLIGRWSAERHTASMTSDDFAYLIALEEGRPAGFAILRDLADPHGNVGLQRIAMVEPGRGRGRAFLSAVLDWTFAQTPCHRLCLEVFTDNARARRVYRSLGFVEEGVLRQVVRRPDGRRADQFLMSIHRPEWSNRTRPTFLDPAVR